jgi:LmbE family N-acetylglucosaminyl deacetylase
VSRCLALLERHAWAALRAVRDLGFRTRLRAAPGAPAVLLSPHPDDAVINCWSLLTADREVTVVNVFTAAPPPGTLVHWDRLCRAGDSASLMAERLVEDGEALALAGRRPVGLGFPAEPYRSPRGTPTLRRLDAALAAVAPAASLVLAPAVVGTVHPDHLLVRAYALALRAAGVPVELYADAPYAVQFGWPSWVTGEPSDPRLDPEVAWRAGAAHLASLDRGRARVATLGDAAAAAKLAAMRTYRSQFAMLDRGPIGQLSERRVHGFEVFWRMGA